jgi:hypothetical protein
VNVVLAEVIVGGRSVVDATAAPPDPNTSTAATAADASRWRFFMDYLPVASPRCAASNHTSARPFGCTP